MFLRYRFLFMLAAVIACQHFGLDLRAQDVAKDARTPQASESVTQTILPPLNIEASVDITDIVFPAVQREPFAVAMVDLEGVSVDQMVNLRLTIHNGSQRDLSFVNTTTSCVCFRFTPSQVILPSGANMLAEVNFSVPRSSIDDGFEFSVESRVGGHRDSRIVFRGKLVNHLQLQPSIFLRVGEGMGRWRIPVVYSSPVDLNTLSIEKSAELDDIQLILSKDQQGIFIDVLANDKSFGGDWKMGAVRLVSTTGPVTESKILISRQHPVEVSPAVLRFRAEQVDGEKVLKSSIIIRIDGRVVSDADEPSSVDFKCGSLPIAFKLQKLARGIYKATLKIDEESIIGADHEAPLDWEVRFKDGRVITGNATTLFPGE